MILTREVVDVLASEHDRTSCTDEDLANSFGKWSGEYNPKTGEKVIWYPRCTRCYLLDNLGRDTSDLDFKLEVSLVWANKEAARG